MTDIRSFLGTAAGDRYLSNPNSAQALYEALTGGGPKKPKSLPPGAVPAPQDDGPSGPKRVESQRIDEVYNSRNRHPGVGYPSCSRALARRAKPFRDNNGYYKHLGVLPSATESEIRKALATKYRRTHPDTGWAPDTEEFMYLREIAKVLLNPARRERYDNLPDGDMWLDSRVKKQLESHDSAIVMGYVKDLSEPETMSGAAFRKVAPDPETLKKVQEDGNLREDRQQAMAGAAALSGYDYFASPWRPEDRELAQRWYEALVAVAPLFRFTRAIRVWLHDGDPEWSDMGGIMKISRSWTPNTAQAFALFSVLRVS